ncbi:MAG: M48 family metallopeptidase [Planctomycetales bacterium]|nr:M48 family metallopeptidase [Planctomycetales bacterium]
MSGVLRLVVNCRTYICVFGLASQSATLAQPPGLKEFADFSQQFAEQSTRFMPDFMQPISAEQLTAINAVEIPIAEERQFGQLVLNNYSQSLRQQKIQMLRQGPDIVYLKKLVSHLLPLLSNHRRYTTVRVTIVESDGPDAFSIPGGDILITRGLLDSVRSEAMLIGVLAHELSHLDRGHQLFALRQAKVAQQKFDFRTQMNAMAAQIKPFHAEFESQADQDAFQWLVQLGYDPMELVALLESWNQNQDASAPWLEFMPTFIRSHPDAGKRVQALRELYSNLPKPVTCTYVGTQNLKLRIPRSDREFNEQ